MALKYDTQEVSVCTACIMAAANGEWGDDEPEALSTIPDGWHLIPCSGDTCEEYFSHSRCETCGAIAGTRHDATLMTIDRVEVDE